jgi:tetratricopeptide (TPR) repeat protein
MRLNLGTDALSRLQGNAAFKSQQYPLAISHYSTAIALDPSVSTYPLNRALVHLKLNQWNDAEKDANTALDLDGGVNLKALFRRGLARKGIGKLEQAKQGTLTLSTPSLSLPPDS